MYLNHFGLERSPFKITPDTSLFYEGGNRGAALEAIKYAILQGEGIIKVVGEVGSGKTMLCRMLEVKLPDYVEIVYLANPSLSPEKILHVIANEMKLEVNADDDKSLVMQTLQSYLLDRHSRGRQVVVFIEEAQGMPLETLEEIRLLSNLETDHFKMLQMVLFGQPELDENLAKRQIRQLKERITLNISLDVFEKKDIQSYLNFRIRVAGNKEADLFNERLAGKIAKYSKGLTRRINILADKSLLAAYSEGSEKIKPKHIKMAAKDSQYSNENVAKWLKIAAIICVMLIFIAIGWYGRDYGNDSVKPDEIKSSAATVETEEQLISESERAFELDKVVKVELEVEPEIAPSSLHIEESITEAVPEQKPALQQYSVVSQVENKEPAASISNKSIYSSANHGERENHLLKSIELSDLLKTRLHETAQWLKTEKSERYSIQLVLIDEFGVSSLEDFLANMQKKGLVEGAFVYQVSKQDRIYFGLLYGAYERYSVAARSMQELGQQLKIRSPFVRTISTISTEYQ